MRDGDRGRPRPISTDRLLPSPSLAIPHYIWIFLWSIGAAVVAIINWFATLITGQSLQGLHNFLSAYVRYVTHFYSYLLLAANPYPGFTGEPNSYPIHVEIDAPARQRTMPDLPALPAFVLASTLVGSCPGEGRGRRCGAPSGDGAADDIGFFFRRAGWRSWWHSSPGSPSSRAAGCPTVSETSSRMGFVTTPR